MNDETMKMEEGAAAVRSPAPRKIKSMEANAASRIKKIVSYFILTLFLLWILVPFYIIIITSFKSTPEANSADFTWWPMEGFDFSGYALVFEEPIAGAYTDIMTGFLNTLWIIIPPTLMGLFTSALAAYALCEAQIQGQEHPVRHPHRHNDGARHRDACPRVHHLRYDRLDEYAAAADDPRDGSAPPRACSTCGSSLWASPPKRWKRRALTAWGMWACSSK